MARHCQTPQYACSFAMSLADMNARCAELQAQQYRPIQIVSYAGGNTVSYAAIWTRDLRSSLMRIESNLPPSNYQQVFDELDRDGYRLLSVSGAASGDTSRYSSLWEDGGWTGFVSRAGLSVAEYQAEFDRQQANGYSLIWVNGHATPSGSSYAGIWSKFADPDRRARHNLPLDDYQEVFDDYAADGYRIAHFNAHRVGSQTYVAAIWTKGNAGYNPAARHNMTDCQLQNELERRAFEDSRPIGISGYATAAGTRYGAIWVTNSRNMITQGRAGAGLDAIDDNLRSLMESSRITAASVAVARNGALVLAKGFGNVTDQEEPVSPTAIFRVASVSKALTGTAIVKLIEDKKLKFDDRLLDLLGTPDDVKDDKLRDVTVDHLLHHRGGWHVEKITQPDPMYSDETIAADLGLSLPITQESIFRWTSSQRSLNTPGMTYEYSNYGYMLLGMIVERVTGQRYEDFVNQNLLAPLGIRRMRCTKTLFANRLPGEVVYHHPHSTLYPNVMEAGAPVEVLQMYGSLNFVNMAAHGGWVASTVDLVKFASAFDDPVRCPILSPSSVNTLFNRLQPATATYSYGCGWEIEPGPVTKMYKTGSFHGTSALIYRQSDGINVAVILNHLSGETCDLPCDRDSTTPQPAPEPTWDLVQVVTGWVRGVKTWPTLDMFSEFF